MPKKENRREDVGCDNSQTKPKKTARIQPLRKRKEKLRERTVDCRQVGVVDVRQNPLASIAEILPVEKSHRSLRVGILSVGKHQPIPKKAVMIIFKQRFCEKRREPEDKAPDNNGEYSKPSGTDHASRDEKSAPRKRHRRQHSGEDVD